MADVMIIDRGDLSSGQRLLIIVGSLVQISSELYHCVTLTSPSQAMPTIRNLIVHTKAVVRVIMIMMPRLQDLLTLHAVIESRADLHKRSDNDQKPLSRAQVSAINGRHIGHEPRDEFEFVGATSVYQTHEPPVETPDTPRTKKAKYIQRIFDEGYSFVKLIELFREPRSPLFCCPCLMQPTFARSLLLILTRQVQAFYLELLRVGIDNATAISCTGERIKRHSQPLAKHDGEEVVCNQYVLLESNYDLLLFDYCDTTNLSLLLRTYS
jgi:hypothetical protein